MKNSRPIIASLPWLLALPVAAVFAQQMPDTARALKTLMEGSYGNGNGGSQAAAPMQAMAAAHGVSVAGGTVHTVRPGETLARVVQQVYGSHPYKDAPVFRLIVQRNPDAFIGGNHNRLRAGAQLVLPSTSDLHAALTGQQPLMQGRMSGSEAMSARSGAATSPASGKANYPGPSAAAGQSTSSSDPRRGWVRFP
jgi:Tfp pilus assembly protein FimV